MSTLPSWMKPPPSAIAKPQPKPTPRAKLIAQLERATKLQLRRLARRTSAASRRKRPPKALADLRATLGRLEAAIRCHS